MVCLTIRGTSCATSLMASRLPLKKRIYYQALFKITTDPFIGRFKSPSIIDMVTFHKKAQGVAPQSYKHQS